MDNWVETAVQMLQRDHHGAMERVENLERELAEMSAKLEAVSRAVLAIKTAVTTILKAPLDKAGALVDNEEENPPRLAASMDS